MIAKQINEIILDLKTETRRCGACNNYRVGHSQAVVPKMFQPAVWYRDDQTGIPVLWPDGTPYIWKSELKYLSENWLQLRALILDKHTEPLHAIDETGAIAEGVLCDASRGYYSSPLSGQYFDTAVLAYAGLWDFINGKTKGKRWQDNPEVKVIQFKREVRG